ncbi:hypothetical protein [Brevibacillus borstelensis]|jgi:hypothetical protein|uniref:hypothetical protein n=1 Tax=Brevibacillus borstelensis TaxID=45462 RepID=UPI001FAA9BAB|nr:hypothetical protein [Brevibacillus borstelensis]
MRRKGEEKKNWMIQQLAEERGTMTVTALFFLICTGGLLSIMLIQGQASLASMRVQQTADIVSKGARAAGAWEYQDADGETKKILVATSSEAKRYEADIVRGAREEAGLLWELNRPAVERQAESATVVHQKGERKSLYGQGIYHVKIEARQKLHHLWGESDVTFRRVSQSGMYDF